MGLFEKKFCDICGGKVNTLTQKKLSDGYLCSDCKHKLGSFTSGWKQRTVQDVKNHLEQREQNKQKYQQFSCSASAGGKNNSLQADFNNRWFIFAVDNRDYKNGNPQVFDFSQLQDFWIEQEFRTLSDSDRDGVPDRYDNYDNRQNNNSGFRGGFINMQSSMVNVPLSAQPFVRNSGPSFSSSGVREVSGIKVCFKVSDPYILDPIRFSVSYIISSGNQRELMEAYDSAVQVMQLCQQIKQGGAPNMSRGYGQPMDNGFHQPGYGQNDFAASAASAFKTREQEIMESVIKDISWNCKSCGLPNEGTLTCRHCGTPVSDESVLALARHLAKSKMMLEYLNNSAPQGNPVPMQQSAPQGNSVPTEQGAPQSWICSACGAQNSGRFCASCGAKRP